MLDVGDDDLAQLQLEQAHLLAQDDRHQQVERPGEDVEVEIELGDRLTGCKLDAAGADAHAVSRTRPGSGAAIARAFSAPAASAASSAASSGRSSA